MKKPTTSTFLSLLLFTTGICASDYILVSNNYSNTLSVIDSKTLSWVVDLPTGLAPLGVMVNSDCTKFFVINRDSSNIYGYSIGGMRYEATIVYSGMVANNKLSASGDKIAITLSNCNSIFVYDTKTLAQKTIVVPQIPASIDFNPKNDNEMYVMMSNGTLGFVNVEDGSFRPADDGGAPYYAYSRICYGDSGNRLYVVTANPNRLVAVATDTGAIAQEIALPYYRGFMQIDSQETRLYFSSIVDRNLYVLDLSLGKVSQVVMVGSFLRTLMLSEVGNCLAGVDMTRPGICLFNLNEDGTLQAPERIAGFAGLDSVFSPDGTYVYVAETYNNSLGVYDVAQRVRVAQVAVGVYPAYLALAFEKVKPPVIEKVSLGKVAGGNFDEASWKNGKGKGLDKKERFLLVKVMGWVKQGEGKITSVSINGEKVKLHRGHPGSYWFNDPARFAWLGDGAGYEMTVSVEDDLGGKAKKTVKFKRDGRTVVTE